MINEHVFIRRHFLELFRESARACQRGSFESSKNAYADVNEARVLMINSESRVLPNIVNGSGASTLEPVATERELNIETE